MSYLIPRQHGSISTNHRGEYYWTSKDGKTQLVTEMAIEHVFYAARMLYNHSVPPAFRVLGPGEHFNRYEDIMQRNTSSKRNSFTVLLHEIEDRDYEGLSNNLRYQLEDIAENREVLRLVLEG